MPARTKLRGTRLHAKGSLAERKTLTFVAALRSDAIVAPCVFNQPIGADSFLAWVEQALVPTLLAGDVVVMDNLSFHKNTAVRTALRAAGAKLLFLPAYRPDLNPIERVFSTLKTLLRKADERSADAAWKRIGRLLDEFKPDECGNYLTAAGYVAST